MNEERKEAARLLQELLIASSPLIEAYTAAVCPGCTDVCCRQKHGTFKRGDLAYLAALGREAPPRDPGRDPEGPCEAMGPSGCRDPRWERPFQCTWYFCGPLLAALDEGSRKKARELQSLMERMIGLYRDIAGPETR
jgi:hypothetical protein